MGPEETEKSIEEIVGKANPGYLGFSAAQKDVQKG